MEWFPQQPESATKMPIENVPFTFHNIEGGLPDTLLQVNRGIPHTHSQFLNAIKSAALTQVTTSIT